MQTVIEAISSAVDARLTCERTDNGEWQARWWTNTLGDIAKDVLPSGAGFDNGTTIDLEKSKPDRVVLHTSFHHMNEDGYYDGWTDHTITVQPSFIGHLVMGVSGRDRNGIKDFIYQVFEQCLNGEYCS